MEDVGPRAARRLPAGDAAHVLNVAESIRGEPSSRKIFPSSGVSSHHATRFREANALEQRARMSAWKNWQRPGEKGSKGGTMGTFPGLSRILDLRGYVAATGAKRGGVTYETGGAFAFPPAIRCRRVFAKCGVLTYSAQKPVRDAVEIVAPGEIWTNIYYLRAESRADSESWVNEKYGFVILAPSGAEFPKEFHC